MRGVRHPAAAATVAGIAAALLLGGCTAGRSARPSGAGSPPPGASNALRHARQFAPGAGHKITFSQGSAHGPQRVVIIGPGHAAGGFFVGPGGAAGVIAALPVPGSGGSSAGRPQITVGPIPPPGSAQSVAMPLDSYEQVSVQQQDALTAAADLLTQKCMAAAGFSYPVAAEPGSGAETVGGIEDGGYGVASLTQAQSYGYKQPAGGAGSPDGGGIKVPGFVGEQRKHGQAWTSALLGFVPGARAGAPQREGCLQAADTALYGKLSGDPNPDPVPGIAIQAAQWTQSDPRVLAVQRLWSACMAQHGYTAKSPAQIADRGWPSSPTPAEIATAVADVQCKTRTNLVNTWLAVEAAYQAALISQNSTSLARLQSHFGGLLRRAENLLQGPAGAILRISQGRASRAHGWIGINLQPASP